MTVAIRTDNVLRRQFLVMAKDPLIWLIALIVIVGTLTSPYYLTAYNIENLLRSVAVIGLLSLGITAVLLTGRIDLSVAAVMVFSVIAGVFCSIEIGKLLGERWVVRGNSFVGPAELSIFITLSVGALLGLINGLGVTYFKVSSFIMTLVALTALRGGNFVLTDGHPFYLQSPITEVIGDALFFGLPLSFLAFLIVLAILIWLINGTEFGKRIYAIGGNEKAAIYAGIKTARYVLATFVISGMCAAIAGIVFTSRLKSVDSPLASGYELTAIAIAVIGGTALTGGVGSPWRTLLGAIAFAGGLNLLSIWGVGTWYQNLIVGFALLVAVGLSPASRQSLRL